MVNKFIQYLRIVGMLCGLSALSLPAQAVYPSKQPIVQVSTAQTAMQLIVKGGSNFTERRSSGLSLEGPGVFIGSRQNSNDQQNQNTTATASTIGSTNGNVTIRAGGAYTQTGSDILAPALGGQTTHPDGTPANGNISIVGRSVSITEARETAAQQTEIRARQSGLTVSVGSGAVSAAQGAASLAQAASTTSSGRMQLLGAAGAASGCTVPTPPTRMPTSFACGHRIN